MANLNKWKLWRVNSVVYTLENAAEKIDAKNNLIFRCIPRKMPELRKMARRALDRIEMRGIAGAIRTDMIKPYKSAKYPLFEVDIGNSTVWRMFSYKDGGDAYIIVFDVFESHKGGKNKLTNERATRSKAKYDIAASLSEAKLGGAK